MEGAMLTIGLGQWMTIMIMAVALGMDAFSLGIGIGLKGIRRLDILKLGAVIAFFHIVMPLMGMFMGQYVGSLLGHVATSVGGGLLLLLGGHMVYNSLRSGETMPFDYRSLWGMMLFALSVSIDSFSVGVSLGMFVSDIALTVLSFGLLGGLMSVLGLMLGRTVSHSLGGYGEACGGIILLIFGIMFLI